MKTQDHRQVVGQNSPEDFPVQRERTPAAQRRAEVALGHRERCLNLPALPVGLLGKRLAGAQGRGDHDDLHARPELARRSREQSRTEEKRGLECRACGCKHFRVIYTRPAFGARIMRRRECCNCGQRIITWEKQIGD